MKSDFRYIPCPDWPRLAWLAELGPSATSVNVYHGAGIDTHVDWFCEAVWDGDFADGNFDQTDIVAGSGGRCRDRGITFVSSSSLLDRLNYIELADQSLVSNSLSALVAVSGTEIDITYPFYQQDLGTICYGLDNIVDRFRSSAGDLRLLYFENLRWNGQRVEFQPKPRPNRDFSTFSKYYAFLQSTITAVIVNSSDSGRQTKFDPIVPLSNGYDSPAVAVLAMGAGVSEAFSISHDRDGNDDCGDRIGHLLGYTTDIVDREAWRNFGTPEIDCIAGCGAAGEVVFAAMTDQLQDRLMLSGLWGGCVWKRGQTKLDPVFADHDGSGMCFTEWRLKTGFIHCPIPFWGGLQVRDIVRLSNSAEMSKWSVPGHYDRPISRRIVEGAGVPRGWFGMQKHGSSDHLLSIDNFLPERSYAAYRNWLRKNALAWFRRGRIPPYPWLGSVYDWMLKNAYLASIRRLLIPLLRRLAQIPGLQTAEGWVLGLRRYVQACEKIPRFHRRYTFPWALEISSGKYRRIGSLVDQKKPKTSEV